MLKISMSRHLRAWFLLFVAVASLSGCGDSQDFVFTGTTNNNINPGGNALNVNLDTSPVQARISGDAISFEIQVYDANLALVAEETAARQRASATFNGLPDGTFTVRVIGLDANGDPIGYFDRVVTLDGDASVTIEGLVYTSNIPPIGSTNAPFLVVTELPDAITGGNDFLIEVTAYDARGVQLTSASGSATLNANGLNLAGGNTSAAFANGKASFPDLSFAEAAEGNVTFSVTSAAGNATTPSIPVSPAPPVGSPRLVFTTVPATAVADELFSPVLQVQLRDENDDPVTDDDVSVTLSIESGPIDGALEGTVSVDTIDGVATFPGVSATLAGTYTLAANAEGYDEDISSAIVVSGPAPFTRLAVGDYTADRIYIYSLDTLNDGINNVTPTAIIGTDLSTEDNYGLESAGSDAVWFTVSSGDQVKLFTNLNDGDNNLNNEPAGYLNTTAGYGVENVSYDEGRDILYGAGFANILDDRVEIWDDALDTLNNVTPTRAITGFTGDVYTLVLDPSEDRLFVVEETNTTSVLAVHVFETASDLDGDQANITHNVSLMTVPATADPYSASYDRVNDRLWFGSYNKLFGGFLYLDGATSLAANVTANTVRPAGASYFWDTAYDYLTGTLYGTDYDNSSVAIYDNADDIIGNSTQLPSKIISGSNTLLKGPDGITLLR
jgi:hypothetical protein